jgi:hypothetical protein
MLKEAAREKLRQKLRQKITERMGISSMRRLITRLGSST